LGLWLFLTANVFDLSRNVKISTVDMLIILQFFGLRVNIFLTQKKIYQETQGFSFLTSGFWADF
jgi:hypothetical protein